MSNISVLIGRFAPWGDTLVCTRTESINASCLNPAEVLDAACALLASGEHLELIYDPARADKQAVLWRRPDAEIQLELPFAA
jgi:hypothetical protein